MSKPDDAYSHVERAQMPSADPIRDGSHTISSNGTNTVVTEPIPPAKPPATPPRQRSFAWLWLLILGGAAFFGYRYWHAAQQKQQAAAAAQASRAAHRAVPVVGVPARTGEIPIYLRGLGSVAAFNSVTVKSRVDGQLIAVHFEEGQYVKQGDLLAEIDPRPFQVQLESAEGQLARDQAQLNDARVNLARYQALWDAKVIAKQQLDTQAALVGQYQGAITADQSAIDNAKLQLTYAHITAPISGRIGLRLVDVGNIVHAADANGLALIAQLQPIAVLFTIPADNLPPVLKKLQAGAKLPVDAYDRDDRNKLASGSLLTVDNQIDPTTGTSRLKAVFNNADNALFPNQFVNCRLLLDTRHNVVIVPAPAIQRGPSGSYVYVVNADQTVTMRPVTVGIAEGNDVEVTKGLNGGAVVVTDGQEKLQDGNKVDVHTPNAPNGSAPRLTRSKGSPAK
jgi:multidrug efflux system membrane fusion protein